MSRCQRLWNLGIPTDLSPDEEMRRLLIVRERLERELAEATLEHERKLKAAELK
jgi:hypothetical protein